MRQLTRAAAVAGLLLLLLTAGCYTVLKHPTGSEVVQEGSYYRSCADCHADASFYHPYGHQYYRYGRSHYRWGGYYGNPWWYDDYWWWDPYDDDGDHEGPEVETGTRHLWSSSGWASGGWGFTKSGSGPRVPTPPRKSDDDKKEEKKEEEKKEETERNLWKKPKKKGF